MNSSKLSASEMRRKRTRSLIQIGGLVEKSGLLETFTLSLGTDFQKNPDVKNNIAALFKGFLVLDALARSEEIHLPLWASQGLEALKQLESSNKKSTEPRIEASIRCIKYSSQKLDE